MTRGGIIRQAKDCKMLTMTVMMRTSSTLMRIMNWMRIQFIPLFKVTMMTFSLNVLMIEDYSEKVCNILKILR